MALSGTINGSVTLNSGKFSFYATWSAAQNVAGNYSDVTVNTYWEAGNTANTFDTVGTRDASITINGTTTPINKRFDCSPWPSNPFLIQTATTRVYHNNDGTKSITISARANGAASSYGPSSTSGSAGDCTLSASITLNTIPRTSKPTLSATTIEMGKTLTITTNRATSSFTHKLYYGWYGDEWYSIANNVGASYVWTVPTSFANNIPDAESGWGTIRCETYNGSTLIGTADVTFKATVPAGKPECAIQVLDATNVMDTYGNLVKGKSKLYVKVTSWGVYGSPISSCRITADGNAYSATEFETYTTDGITYYTAEFTTAVLKKDETVTVSATVTDKRGRPSEADTASFPVLDYWSPSVTSLSVHRCNGDGTENAEGDHVEISFGISVTPLNDDNSAAYTIYRKKSSENDYGIGQTVTLADGIYSVSNGSYIFAADPDSSYDVRIVATDDFGNGPAKSTSVSTAFTLLNFGADGRSMGLGKVVEKEHTFEVAIDSDFQGNVSGKAFGLGTLPIIPENSNIDDYVFCGSFSIKNDAMAATMSNLPIQTGGRLIVSACTGCEELDANWDYREQLFLPHDMFYGKPGWIRKVARQGGSEWSYGVWNSTALQSYPVNSIYISYSHVSPASLFGGSWTRISNAFLWATTSGGTIGQTGGAATHSHGKGDLVAAIGTSGGTPSRIGFMHDNTHLGQTSTYSIQGQNSAYKTGETINHNTAIIGETGDSSSMPPYIQVSIWRRTA